MHLKIIKWLEITYYTSYGLIHHMKVKILMLCHCHNWGLPRFYNFLFRYTKGFHYHFAHAIVQSEVWFSHFVRPRLNSAWTHFSNKSPSLPLTLNISSYPFIMKGQNKEQKNPTHKNANCLLGEEIYGTSKQIENTIN